MINKRYMLLTDIEARKISEDTRPPPMREASQRFDLSCRRRLNMRIGRFLAGRCRCFANDGQPRGAAGLIEMAMPDVGDGFR